MKQMVKLLDDADGELSRDALRGRVHGGLLPPAKRRGLIEENDGIVSLTERGTQVAQGTVEEIPEVHREVCGCGLVVDQRDAAQMDYLKRHQEGDEQTRVCPLFRRRAQEEQA